MNPNQIPQARVQGNKTAGGESASSAGVSRGHGNKARRRMIQVRKIWLQQRLRDLSGAPR
jgi:hypothetical protein